jgi:hypothetical protein
MDQAKQSIQEYQKCLSDSRKQLLAQQMTLPPIFYPIGFSERTSACRLRYMAKGKKANQNKMEVSAEASKYQ